MRLFADATKSLLDGRFDDAGRQGERGVSQCGPRAGFDLVLGLVALERNDMEGASRFFEKALAGEKLASQASLRLLEIFPRLSRQRQAELSVLGSTADAPIRVLHLGYANEWLMQVACLGGRIDKLDSRDVRMPGASSYSFECPAGTPRRVHFFFEQGQSPNVPRARITDERAVQRILYPLRSRFGIKSIAELREALAAPLDANRSTGWLLRFMKDAPSQLKVYRQMVRENPDDVEAVVQLHLAQVALGDLRGALATLMAAKAETVVLLDSRSTVTSTSALFSYRCRTLRLLGRTREAMAECRTAIERGSKVGGPSGLGALLFLSGKDTEALEQIDSSLARDPKWEYGHYLRGLVLRFMGRDREALEAWQRAPTYGPAVHAGAARARSRAEWMRLSDAYDQDQFTMELALCGHYYLDLDMPERSAACFSAAEKLRPELALAERIDHQAETDPERALRSGQKALRKNRHPSVLRAVAAAHQRAGSPQEALRLLDEALKADPGEERAKEVVTRVCAALGDAQCLQTFRSRAVAKP